MGLRFENVPALVMGPPESEFTKTSLYCAWPLGTLTRSVSEGVKPLPR